MHLELVDSMDTEDYIICLRRFINRRGEVKVIRCDNGSNFVGAQRELKKSLEKRNQARTLINPNCFEYVRRVRMLGSKCEEP